MKQLRNYVVLIASVMILAGVQYAAAEPVYAKKDIRLYKEPGEKSTVVARVKSGNQLRIISQQGRWLKVRANGRTGWITRTSVTRRSGDSGFGGSFEDGRSSIDPDREKADPIDDSDLDIDDSNIDDIETANRLDEKTIRRRPNRRMTRAEKRRLRRAERKDQREMDRRIQLEVERRLREERGQSRSERSSKRGSKTRDNEFRNRRRKRDRFSVEDRAVRTTVKETRIDANAALGYGVIGMKFTSNGNGELANYNLSSNAATLRLNSTLTYQKSEKLSYGADFTYTGSMSSPGIRVQVGAQAADTGFSSHEIALAGRVGYTFNEAKQLKWIGRLGFYHQLFSISSMNDVDKNLALLPSETLSGATIGSHVEYANITSKIGARAGLDFLFPATRSQTGDLEDGATSSVLGAWVTMGMTYRFKQKWHGTAGYRLSYASTTWSGAAVDSQRGHNATSAKRTDTGHLLTIGAATKF